MRNQDNQRKSVVQTTRKIILAVFFVFTLAIGFGFGKIEKAKAGTCYCTSTACDPTSGSCATWQVPGSSQKDCEDKCGPDTTVIFENSGNLTVGVGTPDNNDVCQGVKLLRPMTWVNCLLIYVLRFLAGLLSVAASLFKWIIDAKNMRDVMTNNMVYQMWTLVRDALNIAFILVLLFSAFCTVFQISKYNYKNILLTLIIMALLVNFSYPIARVIIDFSNVLMYYLIQSLHFFGDSNNSSSFFVDIGKNTDLGKIVYQSNAQDSTPSLIAAVVFTFILAVTLLIIAILFFIRLIVLTVLIIFSSVAFVGAIVPFLSSQASKWWDALFRYAFFGPIMIFMIVVSTQMMAAISRGKIAIQTEAFAQSGRGFVGDMAFFAIPIVILWIGIGFAQQMSIAGASAVVGRGQNFMKSVGGWTAKAPFRGVWWGAKKTGVPGATKQRWEQWKKEGWLGSERVAQREAAVAARMGVKGSKEKDMKRRAEEHKKNNTTEAELKFLAANGDAAAAYRLAEDKHMDQKTYEEFIAKNKDLNLHKSINQKVKQDRADIVANYDAKQSAQEKVNAMTATDITNERSAAAARGIPGATTWTDNQVKDHVARQEMNRKAKEEIGKLSAEKFADQNWVEITKGPITPDKRRSLRGAVLAIQNMAPSARSETAKRLSPANRAALRRAAQAEFKINLAI